MKESPSIKVLLKMSGSPAQNGIDLTEFKQNKRLIESLVEDKLALKRQLQQSEVVRERALRLLARYEQVLLSNTPTGRMYHFSDGIAFMEFAEGDLNQDAPLNNTQPFAFYGLPAPPQASPAIAGQTIPPVPAPNQFPAAAPFQAPAPPIGAPVTAPVPSPMLPQVQPPIAPTEQESRQKNTSSDQFKPPQNRPSHGTSLQPPKNNVPVMNSPSINALNQRTEKGHHLPNTTQLPPNNTPPLTPLNRTGNSAAPNFNNGAGNITTSSNSPFVKNTPTSNLATKTTSSGSPTSSQSKPNRSFYLPNDNLPVSTKRTEVSDNESDESNYATPEKSIGDANLNNTTNPINKEQEIGNPAPQTNDSTLARPAPLQTTQSSGSEKENIQPPTTENSIASKQSSINSSQKRPLEDSQASEPKRPRIAESTDSQPKSFQEFETTSKCLSILHASEYGLSVAVNFAQGKAYNNVETLLDHAYYYFCLRNRVIVAAKKTDYSHGGMIQHHCHTCAKVIFKAEVTNTQAARIQLLEKNHECSIGDIKNQLKRLWKTDKDAQEKMKFFDHFYQEFGLPKTKNLIYQYGLRKKSSWEITNLTTTFLQKNGAVLEELVEATNYTTDQLVRLFSLYILRITDKDVNDEKLKEIAASQNLKFTYNTK